MKTTLELYGAQTGNCIRAAIALEEAGLSYTPKLVDLSSGAHKGVDHLALNPAGKVPVLVEKEEGQEPFILTQSNAIILYAAGKAAGRLLPENDRDRAIVLERFFFFVTDVIAVSHAAFSLRGSNAQQGQTILEDRVLATLEIAERYVGHNEFMAGKKFSAADIAGFTITQSVKSDLRCGPDTVQRRGQLDPADARPVCHCAGWYDRLRRSERRLYQAARAFGHLPGSGATRPPSIVEET